MRERRVPRGLGPLKVGIATAAALVLLAGCTTDDAGGQGDGPTAIKLGISVPLSGAVGSSCAPMNEAMNAWFDHVNEEGGIDGARIEVDNRDDGYDASRAVANTKAFISDGVLAVTGQCGSLQPPAQMPLLESAKIPFFFVFGASTTLLDPLSPYYFNLMPTYGEQLVAAVPFAFEHSGKGSVVIMNTTTPDSATTSEEVEAITKKSGGEFLGSFTAPPGTADFSPYVLQMKELNPDYVVLNQIPQDAARLTKAMAANNFVPTKNVIGSNAVAQDTFLSTVDPTLEDKLLVTSDTLVPAEAGETECAKVLTDNGIKVQGVTLRGCGTAQVIVELLNRSSKSLTSESLVEELETWDGVKASEIYEPLSFAPDDHVGVSSLYVTGVRDGDFYQIGTVSIS